MREANPTCSLQFNCVYLVLDFPLHFLQILFILFAQWPSCRHWISFCNKCSLLLICQDQHSRCWNLTVETDQLNKHTNNYKCYANPITTIHVVESTEPYVPGHLNPLPRSRYHYNGHTHTHTHTRLTALCPGLPR